MNLLSSFNDFYRGLSSDGLFFFWIIVFLFCFLVFLTVVLVVKNKKLEKLLKSEQIIFNSENNKEDAPIKEKEEVLENTIKDEIIEDNALVIEPAKEEVIEIKKEAREKEAGPYKKNVLRELNARRQTSPISIDNRNSDVKINEDYGLDEVYLREEAVSPLESMEDAYEVSDSMKFASEIVEKMEEDIKPSNIELTDYEKKQEEEAIISYDELLKVKDKIYNLTEEEETDEFIDQLKSFRLDL